MAKTYEELLEQAAIIRDETAAGKNTATRVGGTITDAVDYVKELQDTYAGIHAEAAEAKTEAAAAKVTAAEAKTNAGSARSIAQSAVLTANGASITANEAKTTADAAQAAANEAKTTADGAKTAAQLATSNATAAKTIANNAANNATAAKATADAASTAAQEAKTNAAAANVTANAAKTESAQAVSTAQEAKDIAEETKAELVEVAGSLSEEDNRLNGLIAENKTKIAIVEDTATKARDTAVSAQKAAENAQSAAETTKSELVGKIDGKQDALTLTVKDNGNIVLANIQGQSKEFMPATPSGDPMHYAFVTAGAEYNDTGADIVKDAPWADLADDDADKTVVHKAGYWYLNGLGDITNEQMQRIYMLTGSNQNNLKNYCNGQDVRTNILTIRDIEEAPVNFISGFSGLRRCTIEVLKVWTDVRYKYISIPYFNFTFVEKLKFVIGIFSASENIQGSHVGSLKGIKIFGIKGSATFTDAKKLSMKSVLYMINNEAATSPITITLHADVYNRCMANADIVAALEAHTNISIASA